MEWWLAGIICFVCLLILLVAGLPVAFSLCLVALPTMYLFWGSEGLLAIAMTAYTSNANFLMIAIPLFILMGECIAESAIGSDAFRLIDAWFGWVPGGVAVTAVASCTVFGAVTGFAPAACSALGPAIIPEIIKRKYDKGFGLGALAAGSGLSIIIPPSILMIIYGFLAEISIGKLFYAGVIPGIIISGIFICYIIIRAKLSPNLAPSQYWAKVSFKERIKLSVYFFPFMSLILLVLGSIWAGAASPSEAAALGAFGSIILLIYYKRFSWEMSKRILYASVRVNCMVMFIVIGGTLFTQILANIGFASELAKWVISWPVSRWIIFAFMQFLVLILGCLLDPASILFICVPIFLPIVNRLGFDLYWFGIILMINCAIAPMTPPVGVVLYVLKSVSPKEVSLGDIIRGSTPYWLLYCVGMLPIIFFPGIISWLPNMIIK
jgi:C4-dicarboxylate transporter DctM subunit